jgi:hypothetical protein
MRQRILWLAIAIVLGVLPAIPAGIHPLTITGASATVAVLTSPNRASWVQVLAPSGNMASVMLGGDTSVSSTVGFPLVAGAGQMLPVVAGSVYTSTNVYVYVATGDTARVLWAD